MACIAFAGLLTAAARAVEPPRQVDRARVESAGIRILESRHLALFTDLPSRPEIDRLPAVFDLAVPQWADYFGVPESRTAGWKARAYLIGDRRRYEALGLLPTGNDEFAHGISVNSEFWLNDQPTDYYRRHLLLHEGTHVFMATFLGGCGPGWYMEGAAELFATHRLDEATGQLALRIMPRDRSEVPMLGRIKLVRDAFRSGQMPTLPAVMETEGQRQMGNESYAWCWAAAKFLDAHPRYGKQFRHLSSHVLDENFNELVRRAYAEQWGDLTAEWQAFVATLDHGYDFRRMAIDFQRGDPLEGGATEATIAADRGWQSSGAWLEAEKPYRLTASGRFQIAADEQDGDTRPWPCEPGGVTIEYHDGRPLGILLGAIDARPPPAAASSFAQPITIGLGTTITPSASGTLYLRVNDSPARLGDNRGQLTVTIESPHSERR